MPPMIRLLLCVVCAAVLSEAQLVQGGYASYDEMLRNAPSLKDSTMELHEVVDMATEKGELFRLRYIAPNGRERTWTSSKRLWGYSDGHRVFIFANGYFAPLQSYTTAGAWFYSMATRASSGPNGRGYVERPFFYQAEKNRSREVTNRYLKELCKDHPELYVAYKKSSPKERDIGKVLSSLLEEKPLEE